MLHLGKLYLIPVPIAAELGLTHIPENNLKIVKSLKYFIGENAKTARAHLKLFGYETIQNANIEELNQHSKIENIFSFIEPLLAGQDVGLMSDAGCPGIADPGAQIVKLAHEKNIKVIPLTGPSSILLSIMASGFTGQNFAFVGYLPIERNDKLKRIKELETLALRYAQAQFFIETPYRNEPLFELLLMSLSPNTYLYVGRDLSGNSQMILSQKIEAWKRSAKPLLSKMPTVFGIYV